MRHRLRSDARSQPVRSKHTIFNNLIGGEWSMFREVVDIKLVAMAPAAGRFRPLEHRLASASNVRSEAQDRRWTNSSISNFAAGGTSAPLRVRWRRSSSRGSSIRCQCCQCAHWTVAQRGRQFGHRTCGADAVADSGTAEPGQLDIQDEDLSDCSLDPLRSALGLFC